MRKLMFAIVFMLAMPFVNAQKWEFSGLYCKNTPQSEFMLLESKAIIDLDESMFSFMTGDGIFLRFNIDKIKTSYEDGYSTVEMTDGIWEAGLYGSDDEKLVLLIVDGRMYSGVLVVLKE